MLLVRVNWKSLYHMENGLPVCVIVTVIKVDINI